ncbi:hypothetical protein BGW80DRAFT_1302717 [Lactifluus volemus]|nr:hypothetical protein BGW80DRAFT_1302717 [Lactifluus volemus]
MVNVLDSSQAKFSILQFQRFAFPHLLYPKVPSGLWGQHDTHAFMVQIHSRVCRVSPNLDSETQELRCVPHRIQYITYHIPVPHHHRAIPKSC